jgi:hypothetical protein
MISFKLIGLLLGLYLSGASATPTTVSRNMTALVPRVVPENMCSTKDRWLRRECTPQYGLDTWADVCWSFRTALKFAYRRGARCPEKTYCEDIFDGQDFTIKCVDRQPPGTSAATTSATDPQIGSSPTFKAPADLAGSQFDFDVKILNSIKASVAAFVLSKFLLQATLFWH